MPQVAPVAVAAAAVFGAVTTAKAAKEAQSEAKKQRIQQAEKEKVQQEQQKMMMQQELEAGEYFEDLTRKQMELQVQSSNIQTLADLIDKKRQPAQPRIITTPAMSKETSFYDNINLAIGRFFEG